MGGDGTRGLQIWESKILTTSYRGGITTSVAGKSMEARTCSNDFCNAATLSSATRSREVRIRERLQA